MDVSFKQSLKAQAHHLKPIIILGTKGLTDAVIAETKEALRVHELIKVKMNIEDKTEKVSIINQLCQQLSADLVQIIGNIAIIYLKNEEKHTPKKPTKIRDKKRG